MRSTPAGFKSGHRGESPTDLLVRLGPTIQVDIGLKSRSRPGEPPDLQEKKVKALIDTGAGGDCIDDALARRLNLPIHDEGEQWRRVILGRSFLRHYRLAYDGISGQVDIIDP